MTTPKNTSRRRSLPNVSATLTDLKERPLSNYYLILIAVGFLTGLGVVMVFSSSMAWSAIEGNSVWAAALRQAAMVVLGIVAMWAAIRVSPARVKAWAPWLMLIAVLLLLAVLVPGIGTGREEVGSQSWIDIGPIRFQPSEFAKVAIAVWGAAFLGVPDQQIAANKRYWVFAGVAMLMTGLIIAEGDVGMAMTFLIMVAVVLFFAGVKLQLIFTMMGVVVVALVALMLGGGFRSQRFHVYFDALVGHFEDTRSSSFQSYQGFLSLADGSATGVGLGQSRAKWFYLPEAKNDFIFAIIGEELGFFGGACVVLAFFALAWFGMRVALKSHNKYMALLAASLTVGVVAQAFINIGYVVGLLPVTGIQLPMLSAGGTSAIITLGSMGLLANCARHEPEAISAMQNYGRPLIDRLLLLPEPTLDNVEGVRSTLNKQKAAPRRAPVVGKPAEREPEYDSRRGAARPATGARRSGSVAGSGGSVDPRSEKRRQDRRQNSRIRHSDGIPVSRPERRRNS